MALAMLDSWRTSTFKSNLSLHWLLLSSITSILPYFMRFRCLAAPRTHTAITSRRCQLISATPKECAKICGLEGADYAGKHSITTSGKTLNMKLETPGGVGTRVYMLDASGKKYKQFQLLNQEFTFDVDMSSLPCGSNGALYFSKMDADGGTSRFPINTAGAAYGTGYCDAQCMKDVKFINGEANLDKAYGACCAEMDIWEANSMATSYTTHPCSIDGQQRCSADEDCGATEETRYSGWCDKPGCGLNPFRMGNKKLYGRGKGFDIDTTRPFTVVTQFITEDNTETGDVK